MPHTVAMQLTQLAQGIVSNTRQTGNTGKGPSSFQRHVRERENMRAFLLLLFFLLLFLPSPGRR